MLYWITRDEQREPLSSTTSGTWESAADDDDLSQLLERIDELLDNGTDLEKENAFQTLQDRKGEVCYSLTGNIFSNTAIDIGIFLY